MLSFGGIQVIVAVMFISWEFTVELSQERQYIGQVAVPHFPQKWPILTKMVNFSSPFASGFVFHTMFATIAWAALRLPASWLLSKANEVLVGWPVRHYVGFKPSQVLLVREKRRTRFPRTIGALSIDRTPVRSLLFFFFAFFAFSIIVFNFLFAQ